MKASCNTYEGIDPELVKIVKRTARRAIGKAGLKKHDQPDIEQELMIAGIEGLKCLREESGTEKAFFSKIIGNRVKSILRERHRKSKNCHACCVSLNIDIGLDDGDVDELINLIDNEHLLRNNSCRWINPYLDMDIAMDLNKVIKKLPMQLRVFCEELKEKPLKEICHHRKISLMTAYRRIARIREELKDLELVVMAAK